MREAQVIIMFDHRLFHPGDAAELVEADQQIAVLEAGYRVKIFAPDLQICCRPERFLG